MSKIVSSLFSICFIVFIRYIDAPAEVREVLHMVHHSRASNIMSPPPGPQTEDTYFNQE